MGIKDFFVRKMIESKMKDIPKEQQEMIINAFQKNPEFFTELAQEIETETKKGKDQMKATMEVMNKHKSKLQEMFGKQ